jgi:predicted RNA-binding protein with PUA-like domain
MAYWLLKTEPGSYSWDDLVRDKKSTWDGVSNPTALINLRNMRKGDSVLVYHTGGERAVVGVAEIARDPYPDPKQNDPKLVVVDVKPKRKLGQVVSLDDIKADATFAKWDLLRISRLSVMPVPPAMWKRIEQLASSPPPRATSKASKGRSA